MIKYNLKANLLIFITSIAVSFLNSMFGYAQQVDLKTEVANVNGKVLTLAHLIAEVASLSPEYLDLSDEYLYDNLLEKLVNEMLLSEKAEGSYSTAILIENQTRAVRASEYIENLLLDIPTYDDLVILYEETIGNYTPETEYSASHILVVTKDEAEDISERLSEGENFVTLASELSIGPSAKNGGSLGWFIPGQMVPEFEAAVLSLEIGMVSRPIETKFGWHIIKLDGERIKTAPTLEELRPQLEVELKEQFLKSKLEELKKEADINYIDTGVDKAIIKDSNLLFDD